MTAREQAKNNYKRQNWNNRVEARWGSLIASLKNWNGMSLPSASLREIVLVSADWQGPLANVPKTREQVVEEVVRKHLALSGLRG